MRTHLRTHLRISAAQPPHTSAPPPPQLLSPLGFYSSLAHQASLGFQYSQSLIPKEIAIRMKEFGSYTGRLDLQVEPPDVAFLDGLDRTADRVFVPGLLVFFRLLGSRA